MDEIFPWERAKAFNVPRNDVNSFKDTLKEWFKEVNIKELRFLLYII
jgi:hypothetical protein